MIKIVVLGSGSKGNSTYLDVDGRKYLVDCGFTKVATGKRLATFGHTVNDIKGVVISHDHKDHVAPWLVKEGRVIDDLTGTPFESFTLSHDAPCVGFAVTDSAGNKVAIVSDTGHVPEEAMAHLFGCAAILVETNYDTDILVKSPYKAEQQKRIASHVGHLRSECAAELVEMVAWPGLKFVVALHLSSTNNHPDLVRFCLSTAAHGTGAEIIVSQQNEPTKMMVIL